jgi:uncharacterized protein (DUF305 family)
VKDLAARIEAAQGPEIQQMRDLLTAWGNPAPASPGAMGPMGGMRGMEAGQMPGMMTGAAFDRMFLQMMIVHHRARLTCARPSWPWAAIPPPATSPNKSSPRNKPRSARCRPCSRKLDRRG